LAVGGSEGSAAAGDIDEGSEGVGQMEPPNPGIAGGKRDKGVEVWK